MTSTWCVTDFVCDEEFWRKLYADGKILYFGYGVETCPTTKRMH